MLFAKDGLVEFSNQSELSNAAKLLIQMNMAPDHLKKEGVTAVMSALTFCKQFALPYSAMNELAYIKGRLGAYGSLVTALAQRDPNYGEIKVMYADKDMNLISLANKNLNAEVYACVIHYKKKTDSDFHEYYEITFLKTLPLLSLNFLSSSLAFRFIPRVTPKGRNKNAKLRPK